jgi:hypothetical protein
MRVVIGFLLLVAIALGCAALIVYNSIPKSTPNAVIGEKPAFGKVGGQAVQPLPENLTPKQHQLLNMAYEIGKETGFKDPAIVQAVLLQETMAGGLKSYRVANPGKDAYFGPMQVKLAAARDVLKFWPELYVKYGFHTKEDDEVKANLILNERFNIDVGSRYLMILKKQYGFSGRELLNAYNRGPGGVRDVNDTYHYAVGAERKLVSFKQRGAL